MPRGVDDSADPRAYAVDPAWVWSDLNRGLRLTASLRVTMDHPEDGVVERRCQEWFARLGEVEPGLYGHGGSSVKVVDRGRRSMVVVLSSGGQDALESLDYTVQAFFEAVIAPEPRIGVRWDELPLH